MSDYSRDFNLYVLEVEQALSNAIDALSSCNDHTLQRI